MNDYQYNVNDSLCPHFMLIFSELVLSHRSCDLEDPMSGETSRTHSTRIIQLWHFSRALETRVQSAFPKACHTSFTFSLILSRLQLLMPCSYSWLMATLFYVVHEFIYQFSTLYMERSQWPTERAAHNNQRPHFLRM